jgi:hypothetical protein
VPGSAVYPRSWLNVNGFEKVDAGVGVGFSFSEACKDALLSLFAHEDLKKIATRKCPIEELSSTMLAELSPDARYVLNVLQQLKLPVRLFVMRSKYSGSVVLAVSPTSRDPTKIAVGSSDVLAHAACIAVINFLAIALGCESLRTVECYLPRFLGYVLDIPETTSTLDRTAFSDGSLTHYMTSILSFFNSESGDLLIANLTTDDVASCGLVAVKALLVRAIDEERVSVVKTEGGRAN